MTPNASWDQCKALAEKHTPGPWEACAPGDYGDFDGESRVVCSADPDDMRRIAVVHWSARHPETDANAHLIAAAPELLEALEELWLYARGLEGIIRDGVYKSEELNDPNAWAACDDFAYNGEGASMRDQVEAAIAKARGQS